MMSGNQCELVIDVLVAMTWHDESATFYRRFKSDDVHSLCIKFEAQNHCAALKDQFLPCSSSS